MYLVLKLEPGVTEVTIDDFFHIELAYSWVSECILAMDFVSEEEFGL